MKQHTTQRQKIKYFIETRILTTIEDRALDYNKVIGLISGELGVSQNTVEEVLKSFILSERLVESRTLSLPENVIMKLKEEQIKIEESNKEQINEELKEAGI